MTEEKICKEVRKIIKESTHTHLSYLYLEALKAKTIMEYGLLYGRSTRTLLYGLRDGKQGHLWNIDWGHHEATEQTVKEISKSELAEYFTFIEKDVYKIPDEWFLNHKFDLIYLDIPKGKHGQIKKCVLSMHRHTKLIVHGHNINTILSDCFENDKYDFEEKIFLVSNNVRLPLGIITIRKKHSQKREDES